MSRYFRTAVHSQEPREFEFTEFLHLTNVVIYDTICKQKGELCLQK